MKRRSANNSALQPAPIATQVVQRDIHAEFMTTLALVGASIERWAVEFRHLQRTEVLEAEEPFTKGQKGSSAMPHKRNPITWERLTGLARVLRGNAIAALENVALWHERDISHSSVERIIFPDSCTLLDYMFGLLTRLMDGLAVYPENMKKNLGLSLGMWNSQTVLLALIKKGLTREDAYDLVQTQRDEDLGGQACRPRRRRFCGATQGRPRRGETFQERRTGETLLARVPFQGSEQPVQETGIVATDGHGLTRIQSGRKNAQKAQKIGRITSCAPMALKRKSPVACNSQIFLSPGLCCGRG